ncbi:MAG: DUF1285 domain-containing protein [Halioglobus sp.]
MVDTLKTIAQKAGRNFDSPPLHLWHPPLSGDIDIQIDREGKWTHDGAPIKRESIVRLFASILRREDDDEYYLVTPGEKWRIRVEVLPLIVTDVEQVQEEPGKPFLQLTLNTGKKVSVDSEQSLYLEQSMENIAAVKLPHGLAALFSRNAWYRLVDMAQIKEGRACVQSGSEIFFLEP